jgi:hexosaminidase
LSRHGHIQDQINHINHAPILLPTAKPIVKKLHGLEHDEKKEQNLQDKEEIKRKQKMLYILNKLERLVHIDLKGAPPKPDYFKEFLPLIKKYGATGVILEYEDMFPYTGRLSVVKHGNAYSKDDIKLILKLAKDNNLTVMPLVQTYGHLEWILKHKDFAHLRENPEFPQVISPCIPETYEIILGISFLSLKACLLYFYLNIDMIDQVIALHPDVPYFHIGCDEVYYKLSNQKCNDPSWPHGTDFTKAFMR